ncbi:MAG: lamin tail domain-containing protein [Patescibacteria group bacterium]
MYAVFLLLVTLFLPFFAQAAVVINEVAWMGMAPREGESIQAAANNEWIEIANTGGEEVLLEGWRLIAEDGRPDITLSGALPGGGYFLLERGSDEIVPSVTGDVIYAFKDNALANTGERLILKDASGLVRDLVDAGSGWPAGDNTTKETMQRAGNSWITASLTPRAPTVSSAAPPSSPPPPPQSGGGTVSPPPADGEAESPPAAQQPAIHADAGENRTVPVGSTIELTGTATGLRGEPLETARFWWNFGDGDTREGRVVQHIYRVPGTYVAGLHVSSGEYSASDYANIAVVPNPVFVKGATAGENGFIELQNDFAGPLDIGGWILEDGEARAFIIPSKTKIGAGSSAAFANSVTGLLRSSSSAAVVVRYSNRTIAINYLPAITSGESVAPTLVATSVAPEIVLDAATSSRAVANALGSKAEEPVPAARSRGNNKAISAVELPSTETQGNSRDIANTQTASSVEILASASVADGLTSTTFFLLATGLSVLAAIGFLMARSFAGR